jgi:hypothetical protein
MGIGLDFILRANVQSPRLNQGTINPGIAGTQRNNTYSCAFGRTICSVLAIYYGFAKMFLLTSAAINLLSTLSASIIFMG